jgi:Ca2+/Na+ antiporter
MIIINNYRFGAYALFAMGLINLRYQTGSEGNLSKSAVLIAVGAIVLVLTFIPKLNDFFMKKIVKSLSLILLVVLIAYGILI